MMNLLHEIQVYTWVIEASCCGTGDERMNIEFVYVILNW